MSSAGMSSSNTAAGVEQELLTTEPTVMPVANRIVSSLLVSILADFVGKPFFIVAVRVGSVGYIILLVVLSSRLMYVTSAFGIAYRYANHKSHSEMEN